MSENRFAKMVQTAREHQAGDDAIATTILKKRGPKTKGKRSHPDYETVTHYLVGTNIVGTNLIAPFV